MPVMALVGAMTVKTCHFERSKDPRVPNMLGHGGFRGSRVAIRQGKDWKTSENQKSNTVHVVVLLTIKLQLSRTY